MIRRCGSNVFLCVPVVSPVLPRAEVLLHTKRVSGRLPLLSSAIRHVLAAPPRFWIGAPQVFSFRRDQWFLTKVLRTSARFAGLRCCRCLSHGLAASAYGIELQRGRGRASDLILQRVLRVTFFPEV